MPLFPDLALYRTTVRSGDISRNDRAWFRRYCQATPWPRRIARIETQARHQFHFVFALGCVERRSSVSRQLAASPMLVFPQRVENAFGVTVKYSHRTYSGE